MKKKRHRLIAEQVEERQEIHRQDVESKQKPRGVDVEETMRTLERERQTSWAQEKLA